MPFQPSDFVNPLEWKKPMRILYSIQSKLVRMFDMQ